MTTPKKRNWWIWILSGLILLLIGAAIYKSKMTPLPYKSIEGLKNIDKVIEIGANYIVGVKGVTVNEPFFQGHFPEEPVMPGVLQVEAMAQVGGLLVLNSVDDPDRYSTYFMKIDGVKFRQKVVPGDTLIFRVELLSPIRRGISTMKGYAFVGEKVVCEAEFMAQIVKNK